MKSSEVKISLSTQRFDFFGHIPTLTGAPGVPLSTHEVVTGMRPEGDKIVENPYHCELLENNKGRLSSNIQEDYDSITLPTDKATRLIGIFRQLRPGHQLECHDFMETVEGCGGREASGEKPYTLRLLSYLSKLESGVPYGIAINQANYTDRIDHAHSVLGTDSGKTLSLMGYGSMVTLTDVNTSMRFHARGYEPKIAQIIPVPAARHL